MAGIYNYIVLSVEEPDKNVLWAKPSNDNMTLELLAFSSGRWRSLVGTEGKSAYEEALDKGYVGSFEEWLMTMKGPKGDTGETGQPGPQGEQGVAGRGIESISYSSETSTSTTYIMTFSDGSTFAFSIPKGAQGPKGEDGVDGIDGQDGKDGQDGADGTNGTNGINGVDGEDAYQPFKGWFDSSSDLENTLDSPEVGDYAYVKGATASDPVVIYQCATAGTWTDSGNEFNPANNQEFLSGESLNTVRIVDDLTTGGATNVLSAKQGKELKEGLDALGPKCDQLDAQINGGSEEQDLSEELEEVNSRGYVNYETGEVVTYNGFVVYGADVTGMPSIRISCSGPNSTTNKQGLAFYDANGTYIDGEIYAKNSEGIRELTVPNGAKTVKVSITTSYSDPIKFYGMVASKGIVDDINDIKEELEALPETFGSTDAITDPNSEKTQTTINAEVDETLNGGDGWIDESSSVEWTIGKNINGRYDNWGYDWGSKDGQKASDYIAVSPGDHIIITIPAVLKATDWWGIGYYDANKTAVDCGVTRYVEGYVTANTPREITIPAGVYYIRTTSWVDENTYGAFVYKKIGFVNGLVQRVSALEGGGGEDSPAAKKYAGLKCVAIGDSHTAQRSVWLGRIKEKTGMVHLAELNSLIYFANTTPAAYEMYVNALLAQAQALVDNAPNYDEPDVIFVEEVHQTFTDTIDAKPFIPHNMVDLGYTKANLRAEYEYFDANAATLLGGIASADRHEGTVLRSSVSTSQIVATFSASSVSAGNITITIGGVGHVLSVTSGMTVKQVVDTISVQAFGDDSDWSNTSKTDTTITFSWIGAGEATNNFVIDTGNTGVTITMGSISTTTKYVYRRYNQYDLTDWTDKTKWDSFGAWNLNQHNDNATYGYWTNAYAAMGGVITLLQTHFPKAMIVWMALPNWGLSSAFNPAPKNAAELKAKSIWLSDKAERDKFIEVGELYNLRTIDVECVSGISWANYSTFFTQGNVHPKEDGYKRWGDVIANWL